VTVKLIGTSSSSAPKIDDPLVTHLCRRFAAKVQAQPAPKVRKSQYCKRSHKNNDGHLANSAITGPPVLLAVRNRGYPSPKDVRMGWVSGKCRLRKISGHLSFSAGAVPGECLVSGWSSPEEAHTWSVGKTSILRLPCPGGGGDLQIEFGITPFVAPPMLATQRLEVFVNDRRVGYETLNGPTWIGFHLPRASLRQAQYIEVRFFCPDAKSPSSIRDDGDTRQLGFAFKDAIIRKLSLQTPFEPRVRPPFPISRFSKSAYDISVIRGLTGLLPVELVLQFESLGTNCEFGLFQRRCEAEPLGLLRFAGISYLDLVRGLNLAFEGIEEHSNLSCYVEGPDDLWMVRSERYGLTYHTFKAALEVPKSQLLKEQVIVLRYKREKFFELMTTGEKLFVVMCPQGMSEAQALPLISALGTFGPNALVYANEQTGRPAGTVERIASNLYCGSMDGVSKDIQEDDKLKNGTWLGDAALTVWLSICANAYRLWREGGGNGA
jgi:hypothetical protein